MSATARQHLVDPRPRISTESEASARDTHHQTAVPGTPLGPRWPARSGDSSRSRSNEGRPSPGGLARGKGWTLARPLGARQRRPNRGYYGDETLAFINEVTAESRRRLGGGAILRHA